VLGYLPEIPICTGYRLDGERVTEFPTPRRLAGAQPEYEVQPGWARSIAGARRLADLPGQARRYIDRIEALVGVEIRTISVGPHRDALVQR
jgi:adenylosuccinate synthase